MKTCFFHLKVKSTAHFPAKKPSLTLINLVARLINSFGKMCFLLLWRGLTHSSQRSFHIENIVFFVLSLCFLCENSFVNYVSVSYFKNINFFKKMKISNPFLLLPFLILPLFSQAQNTSGQVFYTETIKIQIELPEGDEEMKKMIPPEQKVSKVLIFNEKASLYKNIGPAGEGNVEIKHDDEEGNDVQIMMKMPEVVQFTNFEEMTWLRGEEFFGRDFLISGDGKKLNWKLTGEQKKINEFVCQKAVLLDTTQNVVAWFTPQIPVPGGPGRFINLPGLILDLEMDNGNRSVKVSKIELKPVADTEIVAPTKGKAVTQAEFEKIQEEKFKEMGIETGGKPGGARVKMIIRNEDRN